MKPIKGIYANNTVKFRSEQKYFNKEKAGLKPNTVREVSMADRRFRSLANGRAKFIEIRSTITTEKFVRKITDITFWNNLVIISWKDIEVMQNPDNITEVIK